MGKLFLLIIFVNLISFISCSIIPNQTSFTPPLLLLISLDGFRWDYPDIYQLPTFNSLGQRGVHVKYIETSFVTATFPLHWTMITGFHEESHGVVGNIIYDPESNATAGYGGLNETKWWAQNPHIEPIWIRNELANDSHHRRSGVISWPGSNIPINGHLPSRRLLYDPNRTCHTVMQQALEWFREPAETRINFGAIYCFESDQTGHAHGPLSSEMNKTLHQLDRDLSELLHMIDTNEYLKTNLNVIVTADHGMHEVKANQRIKLDNYIDSTLYKAYGNRIYLNLFVPLAKNIDRLYRNLSGIPNLEVYKKSQIPQRYHYQSNVRIGDIFLVTKLGWEMISPGDDESRVSFGAHGHDNQETSMHPIFYAFGPAFRANLQAEPFRSVDFYPLMSHVLQLKAVETNGSFENVQSILKEFSNRSVINTIHTFITETTVKLRNWGYVEIICSILVIFMGLIFTIVACRYSKQLVYVQSQYEPIRYRLLSVTEGSTNNFVASDSDSDDMTNSQSIN